MRSHDGRHTKTRLSEDVASRTSDGNPVEISLHYTLVSLFSSAEKASPVYKVWEAIARLFNMAERKEMASF